MRAEQLSARARALSGHGGSALPRPYFPRERYTPEQRRRHHDAHARVAVVHQTAARKHQELASRFAAHGDDERAEREHKLAAQEWVKARLELDTARQFED
jgi:hypothetical protein